MDSVSPSVVVLGAGFTKAFYPNAPLLRDDYDLTPLIGQYKNNEKAFNILDYERRNSQLSLINCCMVNI